MNYKTYYLGTGQRIILMALLVFFSITTYGQNSNTVFGQYFVKKDTILLRYAPSNKEIFDLGAKNGYRITRIAKINGAVVETKTVAESIKPMAKEDTLWSKLSQKNTNILLAYNMLYNNSNKTIQITAKEKEERENMIYNLVLLGCDQDISIAKASGLFFQDNDINNNKTYSYKIEIINAPVALKIAPCEMELDASQLSVNPKIDNFAATIKNKQIKMNWNAALFMANYSGFNIERSEDSIHYQKINNAPVILMSSQFEKNKEIITYNDTFPAPNKRYYYRLKGINLFGEQSQPSNVVSGIGYKPLASMPYIDSIATVENRKVFVSWQMNDMAENLQVKKYILWHAEKDAGTYTEIFSSSTQFSYTDEHPLATNFYKIAAITHGSDTLFSFSRMALIIDSIPPTAPVGLIAKVNKKGEVTLGWNKNVEKDVQGYKIYKANSLNEEFVQINSKFALDTLYNDKLNLRTLTKNAYYKVVATDKNYNNSSFSTPVEVKRPDTIAPVPALIQNLSLQSLGVFVNWVPSASVDVKSYVLLRSSDTDSIQKAVMIKNASDTVASYMDTTVEAGNGYRYQLKTIDADENFSLSSKHYIVYETGFRKKLKNVKTVVDRSKKSITISWEYPEKEVDRFVIYRALQKGKLSLIKSVPADKFTFIDTNLNMGNVYEYRVKAIFKNGAESVISDAVVTEY